LASWQNCWSSWIISERGADTRPMRTKDEAKSEEVDAYLARLAPDRREALAEVRAVIVDVAPDVVETMKYRMPTYEHEDGVLCSFASQKHYMSVYMDPNLVELHRDAFGGLSVGKSCIRFRKLEDLPLETVQVILRETLAKAGSQ
jgi:uncharacterized protein YdhG (YjbR/CyaY superfamily)